jgi:hypothetical protein
MKKSHHNESGVQSPDVTQSGSSVPTKNKIRASSVTRGTTGPRTRSASSEASETRLSTESFQT